MLVRVFSTATCPWCIKAKDFFKKNKIKFQEIDVGKDPIAAQEMIEKTGQMGVPVIEIDGEIIVGFDEKRIKQILKLE